MCGLFGFCAHKGKKINMWKIKLLGIYNTERGTDSCGYYYSGHIEKGVYQDKNFCNFIGNKPILRGDKPIDVFLGHTRRSTFGLHDEKNAHPHIINDNYVQTHNGIIKNEVELSNKYGVKFADAPIDSLVLAHIIEKNGFDVLKEYVGFAALAMVFKDKPESLFLYHGATKEYFCDKELTSERPLYILQQPEGLYYSSMINSLNAINEFPEKEVVQELRHNIVYEIKNGLFTDNVIKINREHVGTKEKITNISQIGNYNKSQNYTSKPYNYKNNGGVLNNNPIKNTEKSGILSDLNDDDIIFYERINSINQDLYYQSGRYYGKSNSLLSGKYIINRNGKILSTGESLHDKNMPEIYYFYFGAMMKDENSYNLCKSLGVSRYVNNMGQFLSRYSKYPTICLDDEYVSFKHLGIRYLWHTNGEVLKSINEFTPKFSNKRYKIKNGKTLSIITK